MASEFLTVGRIVKPRGIKGEVKMVVYTDVPEVLLDLDKIYLRQGGRSPWSVRLHDLRFHKGQALLLLEGIADRNEAELLRGADVLIPKKWMPPLTEDEYYVHQILGLQVVTLEGECLGTIRDVLFTGANDVYVVRGKRYGEVLIPAIADVIREVDLDAGEMRIELLEGLV